jgi:hypothetical protein
MCLIQDDVLSPPVEPFTYQVVNSVYAVIPYHDRCLHSSARLASSDQEVAPANREVMNYEGHKIFPTRTLNCLLASFPLTAFITVQPLTK